MIGTHELNLSTLPGHLECFDVTAEVGLEGSEYGDCLLLYIEIIDRSTPNKDHYGLKFNIDWTDSDRIEWLADILSRNLAENIWNAKKNQRQYIQSTAYQFGKALGLDIHKSG